MTTCKSRSSGMKDSLGHLSNDKLLENRERKFFASVATAGKSYF
ncbi:hypothetical protein SAMN06265784_10721 [Paraburkholderia susongensis]|uniref:Uncharacterized protein n=1 Tax=Paraburkholderia susongensis TaxID=1515439 RepID=A0A1X7LM03_9BURK|nr:hypothetical protein SAMN06265784_10721 [Paraburkholderia susongensis]